MRREGDTTVKTSFSCAAALAACGLLLATAGPAAAADPEPSVVQEILGVLKERGLVDEEDYQRMLARYAAGEKQRQSLIPKLRFYGDLRLRGEGFVYDEDPVAGHTPDRLRARYRLRIGSDADVTDFATVHFRLASSQGNANGVGDPRSSNISFGNQPDFAPGQIYIDRANLELKAPSSWIPLERGSASLDLGKIGNPFVWKPIRDLMLWDPDISPEGAALRVSGEAAQGLDLFFNGGWLIDQENAASKDPYLLGAQLGGSFQVSKTLLLGARTTWYGFRALNQNFICRGATGANCNGTPGPTASGGNIPDGVSTATNGGQMNVGELGAYLTWKGFENWPVTLWGDVGQNFTGRSSARLGHGSESLAWSTGLAVGDKSKLIELGLAYFWVEANAFPSQFVESDWIDGRTNHRSLVFWTLKRLFANTDLQTMVSFQNSINDALPEFRNSVSQADRIRFQTDLMVSF